MTVAVTFPVFPPRGGGQSRIFHFYRHLTQWWNVELVSFCEANSPGFSAEIAPGMREIRVPKSHEHAAAEAEIMQQVNGVPVGDVTMPLLCPLTPAYLDELRGSAATADVIVACHPYLFRALRTVTDKPLWYEAQDVEWELKKGVLPDSPRGRELLELTRQVEAECCQEARLIMVCAERDGTVLVNLYSVPPERIVEVPNGVDLESVSFSDYRQRQANKAALGLSRAFVALFIGSWHGPNLEAVEEIIKLAIALPDVRFLIVGSAGQAFQQRTLPGNIGLLGVVDDVTKDVLLGMADVALNPIRFGSGTNLKMLDYLAAGVPVISSKFGMRGLELQPGRDLFACELAEFGSMIDGLKSMPYEEISALVENGRRIALEKYDWRVIATRFHEIALPRNLATS